MAHRHGSDRQRFFGQELDEQLRCREHNPSYEQGRACKQQDIVEDSGHHIPLRTAPRTADVPGPAADVMGIPPTLRITPGGSIGSPSHLLFLMTGSDYVPVPVDPIRLPARLTECRLRSECDCMLRGRAKPRCAHSGLAPCRKPQSYSITLSARASNSGEMLRPSALAALRLMTRSNLVGCSIGSSPGLARLRILCT
jgi:hypothetical protein